MENNKYILADNLNMYFIICLLMDEQSIKVSCLFGLHHYLIYYFKIIKMPRPNTNNIIWRFFGKIIDLFLHIRN